MKKQKLSCYSGDLVVKLDTKPEKELKLHWEAEPIPLKMWRELTAFLKWAYDEHKCEAQVRLAYNPETREWRTAVLPQTIMAGLASKEFETDVDRETALKESGINDGFGFVGTVHQHCASPAFQSGTDHKDELKQPGYHVTLGRLHTKQADWHSRASFCGVMYPEVNDEEWLPYPKEEVLSLENLPEFPKVWKTRLKKRTTTTYQPGYMVVGRGSSSNAWTQDNYAYCGGGYGHPDPLPKAAAKHASRQYWIKTREHFWDYMIAKYMCFEQADLLKKVELLPVNGLAWNKACQDAAVFANFIVEQPRSTTANDQLSEFLCELVATRKIRFCGVTDTWTVIKSGTVVDPLALYEQFGPTGTTPLAELRAKHNTTGSKVVVIGEKPEPEPEPEPEPKTKKVEEEPELDYAHFDQLDFGEMFEMPPTKPEEMPLPAVNLALTVETAFEVDSSFGDEFEVMLAEALERDNDKLFLEGAKYTPSEKLLDIADKLSELMVRSAKSMAFARAISEAHVRKALTDFGWDAAMTDRFWTVLGEAMGHCSIGLLRSAHTANPKEIETVVDWIKPHILELVIKAKRDYM